jgi:antitoxin PrlF
MIEERTSVVTRKGQVTIPAEIRRSLGLKEGDRVAFVLKDYEVKIVPRGSVTERTAGMFKTKKRPVSAEKLREEAERAIADDAMKRAKS